MTLSIKQNQTVTSPWFLTCRSRNQQGLRCLSSRDSASNCNVRQMRRFALPDRRVSSSFRAGYGFKGFDAISRSYPVSVDGRKHRALPAKSNGPIGGRLKTKSLGYLPRFAVSVMKLNTHYMPLILLMIADRE